MDKQKPDERSRQYCILCEYWAFPKDMATNLVCKLCVSRMLRVEQEQEQEQEQDKDKKGL